MHLEIPTPTELFLKECGNIGMCGLVRQRSSPVSESPQQLLGAPMGTGIGPAASNGLLQGSQQSGIVSAVVTLSESHLCVPESL